MNSRKRNDLRASRYGSLMRFRRFLGGVVLLLAPGMLLLGADKNGVAPNTISVPKGPGSIEGLGESFQPTLNTGTAKYGVGLKVPSGTAGQTPALALHYEAGGGNGPLGFGWELSIPFVQRQSDEGIPTYDANVGFARTDRFISDAKEVLVPQANGDFFSENEGSFVRYRQVGSAWQAHAPDGTRLDFGSSASARIEDGTNRIFSWLLERELDTRGNTIVYSYTNFPGEQNSNQKYISLIRYGPGGPPWQHYHFISFQYEDRSDWFEDCRAGFPVRTGKRLKSILVGTHTPSLPGHAAGDWDGDGSPDYLVRRYDLAYLSYAGTNSHWSLLARITPIGADGITSLPSSDFAYSVCNPPDTMSALGHILGGQNEPDLVMDSELVEFVDLNGDALPDVLETGGLTHRAYLNQGEGTNQSARVIRWAPVGQVGSPDEDAWNFNLGETKTHLADMDGDALADLVHKASDGSVFFFRNRGNQQWGTRQPMAAGSTEPPAPFGVNNVRTADVDFDKRIDLIRGDTLQYEIWFNLGSNTYSEAITVPQANGFDFADPAVQIADLNGDRVPDMAKVWPSSVDVAAGLGYGHFAAIRSMVLPDYTLDDAEAARAKLIDITEDGLADLVLERAASGDLWFWINLGNYQFSTRKTITGMPTGLGVNPAIRWADVNGNGSTDLVYADSTFNPRLTAVEMGELLNGGLPPNSLVAISNGLGRVTLIGYLPSTHFALEDAAAGQAWTNTLPNPITVVSAVTNLDSLGHEYVTRFRYHDGFYDPLKKQFRGFARVEQVDVGEPAAPTLVTRSHFDVGRMYEALKGKLLGLTVGQEDESVFSTQTNVWTVPPITLYTGTNGQAVHYVHPASSARIVHELGNGTARRLESEVDYDRFGNQILNADFGIVEGTNRSAFDDERIITTEYAINTNAWILRTPKRSEIKDENGVVISRTEMFYDDETFAGNNGGSVTIGNLTMRREWVTPANATDFIAAARMKYDLYGNPRLLLDPLALSPGGSVDVAAGHVRELAYDPRFFSYAVTETIHVGNGAVPLVFQAQYDEGFGVMTASLDFNTNRTDYGYDGFARLTSIVKPYDSGGFPTTEYDYALSVPVQYSHANGSRTGLVNYIETRQLDRTPGSAGTKRDHYLLTRQFSDGLGRQLMTRAEAEPAPGEQSPRVVVSGAVLFNARQKPAAGLNPFFTTKTGPLDQLLDFENIEAPGWTGLFHQNGGLVSLNLAAAHKSQTEYDSTLRTVRIVNSDGSFSRMEFEPLVARSFDENDSATNSPYFGTPIVNFSDGLGRLVRVDELVKLQDDGTPAANAQTWTTRYQYDLNDRLTQIVDSQNNVKTLRYDGLKRKISMNDPDAGITTNVYDKASNLIETTDAKNQRVTYTYDGANRILTEDYQDENSPEFSYHRAPDIAYHYDAPPGPVDQGNGAQATGRNTKGMLAWVEDTSGQEHSSYDARGRVEWTVKRVPDPVLNSNLNSTTSILVSYQTALQYDSLDRLTRLIYPDNDEVTYAYNARGLLDSISGGPSGHILAGVGYLPSAQQERVDYGNGVRTTYEYDPRLRLRHLLTVSKPATLNQQLINFGYDLDNVSNVRAIEDLRPESAVPANDPRRNTQRFQYDDLYRLTQVRYNSPANSPSATNRIDYRYDRIGNMLAQVSDIADSDKGLPLANLGSMNYGGTAGRHGRNGRQPNDPPGPHALSQLTAVQPGVTNRVYSYDANGNMKEIDGLRCTWDFMDRLVGVEDDTMRAEYRYDFSGRRIIKRVFTKQAVPSQTGARVAQSATGTRPAKDPSVR
jgi:YD repeat-containing protein